MTSKQAIQYMLDNKELFTDGELGYANLILRRIKNEYGQSVNFNRNRKRY